MAAGNEVVKKGARIGLIWARGGGAGPGVWPEGGVYEYLRQRGGCLKEPEHNRRLHPRSGTCPGRRPQKIRAGTYGKIREQSIRGCHPDNRDNV